MGSSILKLKSQWFRFQSFEVVTLGGDDLNLCVLITLFFCDQVDVVSPRWGSPLWVACRESDPSMVELLLSAGADKNQVKLNLNGWANSMEGCIPRVRMRDAESHFCVFTVSFRLTCLWFMRFNILVLLFSDRKSLKRPNPKSITFQEFPRWNITVSFPRMIQLSWLQWMSPFLVRCLLLAGCKFKELVITCQHVRGEPGTCNQHQSTMVSCSFFAQNLHCWNNSLSCPCRHEPGNPMARHPCMQLANLGSNKAFLVKFTQEVPLRWCETQSQIWPIWCYRLIIWQL